MTVTARQWARGAGAMLLLGLSGAARAQVETPDSGDTAWSLAATILVLLAALPGLALLHAGRVRRDHAASAAIQTMLAAAAASLLWIAIGYSLVFAPGTAWIGSLMNLGLSDLSIVRADTTIAETAFALFHLALAMLAPALLTGAVAERARIGWLIPFMLLWSLFVYVPVAHALWGGWLAGLGTIDFAGGLVIHAAVGASALVLALLIGPRAIRTGTAGRQPALTLAGAALLWIGTIALVGGATLGATDDAAAAMLNAHATLSAALLGGVTLDALRRRPITASGMATAILAGSAASLSCAPYIGTFGAMALGLLAALAARAVSAFIRQRGIDDAMDGFAASGVGGVTGAVLLAPLASDVMGGAGYEVGVSPLTQLVAQLVGSGAVLLWAALATLVIGFCVALFVPMRVPAEVEQEGLDRALHGDEASS